VCFITKLLPALRARRDGMRRTCHRSSFIHCRGVKRRVLLHRAFLKTAAMNNNAVFFLLFCADYPRKRCIHAAF
jgi:hypothetical protein